MRLTGAAWGVHGDGVWNASPQVDRHWGSVTGVSIVQCDTVTSGWPSGGICNDTGRYETLEDERLWERMFLSINVGGYSRGILLQSKVRITPTWI